MQVKINNFEVYTVTFRNGKVRTIHKLNGKRHREDGPACFWSHGYEEWNLFGKFHRIGGPAISYPNGDYEFWENGKLHNLNGPARKFGKHEEFFIEGKQYTKEQFLKITQPNKKKIEKLEKALEQLKQEQRIAQEIKDQYTNEIDWVVAQLEKLNNPKINAGLRKIEKNK